MADFLEKVSYRIGVCPLSAQRQQRGNQQTDAARTNKAINYKRFHNVILSEAKNLG